METTKAYENDRKICKSAFYFWVYMTFDIDTLLFIALTSNSMIPSAALFPQSKPNRFH